MNSFFVSCETAENPDLRGQKVAVVNSLNTPHSLIVASSYEAKAVGVKVPLRLPEALRCCPDLITVEGNSALYSQYSRAFFEYFLTVTPLVEPASIDEGYLDVTEVCQTIHPLELAEKIQKDIYEKINLPCSIGIGPNKSLAKIASDMKKPLGITVLRKREIAEKLWPLPINTLLGVGKKTLPLLEMLKIKTVGDLANYPNLELMKQVLGNTTADNLYQQAHGHGENEVNCAVLNEISSVSNSQTFEVEEYDLVTVKLVYKILANSVANRLVKSQMKAYTITMQLKYNNYKSITRAKSIDRPTNDNKEIYQIIDDLFEDNYNDLYGVRLVGVSASKLVKIKDIVLPMTIFDNFNEQEKEHQIEKILNNINYQQGSNVVKRGIKDLDRKNSNLESK